MEHFSAEEQAILVWQALCCIPVSLMEECLPWMASFLSEEEREEMVVHMHVIVPEETLLRQVSIVLEPEPLLQSRAAAD